MNARNFGDVKTRSSSRVDQTEKRIRWPELSTLEELDVGSVAKVPRVHGAVAPGEPLVAALDSLITTFCRFGPLPDSSQFVHSQLSHDDFPAASALLSSKELHTIKKYFIFTK